MTTIYRCDACHAIIDTPMDDTRWQLKIETKGDETERDAHADICDDCMEQIKGAPTLLDIILHRVEDGEL